MSTVFGSIDSSEHIILSQIEQVLPLADELHNKEIGQQPERRLLAEVVHQAIARVTDNGAIQDVSATALNVQCALRNAGTHLNDVADALSTLSSSADLRAALSRAGINYSNRGGHVEDGPEGEDHDDALAKLLIFIITKFWSDQSSSPVMNCVHALDSADAQLRACSEALDALVEDHPRAIAAPRA